MIHPDNAKAMQRYFEAALCGLLTIAFATLASTGTLDWPTILFVGAALLVRCFFLWRNRIIVLPPFWTTTLTLSCAAFYLFDYILLTGTFLNATVHLVLFVMLIRLYSAQRDRDYYFLAVLSFLMMLSAAALTVRAVFLFGLAAFLLVGVVAVVLMEMRQAASTAASYAESPDQSVASRRTFATVLSTAPAVTVAILLSATLIFFVLPRDSAGYLSAYSPHDSIATGFSEQVRLGRIGEIQQSNAVVMHIMIEGDRAGAYDLKWRGIALNLFDGRRWSTPHMLHLLERLPDGGFSVSEKHSSPQEIRYHVLMEPVTSNVFFLAPTASEVRGNFRTIAGDDAGSAFNVDVERPLNAYNAVSDLSEPSPAQLRLAHGQAPPEILLNDLQLPRLDPRIPRLAEQITASSNSNYDKALALEDYLGTHYAYTLQLPKTLPRDPLADFLFDRKQGHCEYFASSLAVMLRTLRIPARIVNGFRGGEFNDLTRQYAVRGRDAHSWVEAYFPGYGWVAFDPTPAGLAGAPTGWSRAALYLDALSSFWREWIINYDPAHQFVLAENATRGGREWLGSMQQWAQQHYEALLNATRKGQAKAVKSPVVWGGGLASAIIFILLARYFRALLQSLRRWRLVKRPETAPAAAATLWYARMIHKLEKKVSLHKTAEETPREFASRITDELLRARVTSFTGHYESARFGGSVEDVRLLPELLDEIAVK